MTDMTTTEMKAGKELDMRVAEKVLGWQRGRRYANGNGDWIIAGQSHAPSWDQTPRFSRDIAAAWAVLTSRPVGTWAPSLVLRDDGTWWCGLKLGYCTSYDRDCGAWGETAPLAICAAALASLP